MTKPTQSVPTLGELNASEPHWVWLHCRNAPHCYYKEPAALAPFVIRWGPNVSSDKLRKSMRCTACGHKGVSIYSPSWADPVVGWQPFPVEERR